MPSSSNPQMRQRTHAEKMLARAERRSRQAAKLVEKWKARLAELDREGFVAKQSKLWADDQEEQGSETDGASGARLTAPEPAPPPAH
ncbi:MAG: hypothetical protein ACRYFU_05835 [Janthinobacterium lividum]